VALEVLRPVCVRGRVHGLVTVEKVIAFGYRQSTVKVTKDLAGQSHIEIDDNRRLLLGW
jgi:hypothetical protein